MSVWGIVPAAGAARRIQPLAFSKELLPVGSVMQGTAERPRAVSEYLVERMAAGGADRICFVIGPGKSDILNYFGGSAYSAEVVYAVQQQPGGLCDAVFRALPVIQKEDQVLIGLPDTIWFPEDALRHLPNDRLSFLLFPVKDPEQFDAVVTRDQDRVVRIEVKHPKPGTEWIWGAIKMNGAILRELYDLWRARNCADEYLGTLVNDYLERGGEAYAYRRGEAYVDVGTLNGYRNALALLDSRQMAAAR